MEKYYYHASNPCNRENIKVSGLIPSVGECYNFHYQDFNRRFPNQKQDIYPCIFLATTKNAFWSEKLDLIRIKRSALCQSAISQDIVIGKRRRCIRYSKPISPDELEWVKEAENR